MIDDNPNLDFSRIADGIERIANVVDPKPLESAAGLTLEVEVVSIKKGTEDVREEHRSTSPRKCVTYTFSSPDEDNQRRFVSAMSIRVLLRDDPKWRVGQRISLTATGRS